MFHKFKITSCAFILCLFGLTLITVSPVFADDPEAFVECQKIKPDGNFKIMKQKKNCFRDLARKREDEQKLAFGANSVGYAFTYADIRSELRKVINALREQIDFADDTVEFVTTLREGMTVNAHINDPAYAWADSLHTVEARIREDKTGNEIAVVMLEESITARGEVPIARTPPDGGEIVECQKIKPDGNFKIIKQKKNCFRDLARKYEDENKVIFKSAIDYAFAQNAMQSEISTVVDALRKRGIANEAVRIVTNIRMSISTSTQYPTVKDDWTAHLLTLADRIKSHRDHKSVVIALLLEEARTKSFERIQR